MLSLFYRCALKRFRLLLGIVLDGHPLRNVPKGKEIHHERPEKSTTSEAEMQVPRHYFSKFSEMFYGKWARPECLLVI